MDHIITNGLLSKYQYGLIKGKIYYALAIAHDGYVDEVFREGRRNWRSFTDFEKAFDNISRRKLIS